MAHLCKAASTIFMPIRSGCYRMSNGLSTSADDGPSMADGLCLTQPAVGDPLETLSVPPKRSFRCVALCSPRAANAFTCASNRSREKVRQQSSTLALNGIRAERTLEDAPRCIAARSPTRAGPSIGSVGRSRLHERADAVDGFHQLFRYAMPRL